MPTLHRLRKEENYKYFGTEKEHCNKCPHFKHEGAYAGIDGMSADLCRRYIDEQEGGVVILPSDHGVCDSYE